MGRFEHSGARSCTVRARLRRGVLVLEITDDGRGGADPALIAAVAGQDPDADDHRRVLAVLAYLRAVV